jgi:hypothetical protein
MVETPEILSERLQKEGEKTMQFISSLTPQQFQLPIYTEGTVWTIREILSHFATAERGFVALFTGILSGEHGVSPDFDIDRYNASQQKKTEYLAGAELIQLYVSSRNEMVLLVRGMQQEDLERVGRHPFLGDTELREMIKMVYLHNQIHLRDIRKALAASGA